MLALIAEYHMVNNKEGYMLYRRRDSYCNWVNLKEFLGDEYIEHFGKRNFQTNVTETIFCTSVMKFQNRINNNRRIEEERIKRSRTVTISGDKGKCVSQKRLLDQSNIADCEEQDCLEDCFGCSYYRPTPEEIEEFISKKEYRANESAKQVIAFMNNSLKAKKEEIRLEDLFLEAQTQMAQYKKGADILAEEREIEWLKLKNTMKTSC